MKIGTGGLSLSPYESLKFYIILRGGCHGRRIRENNRKKNDDEKSDGEIHRRKAGNSRKSKSKDKDQYGFATVLTIYALYLLGAVLIIPLALVFVGFLVAFFTKNKFQGTIYASHLSNQIKIFLYGLLIVVVLFAALTILAIFPSLMWLYIVLWGLLYVWFVYQSVIGILAIIDRRPRDFAWY